MVTVWAFVFILFFPSFSFLFSFSLFSSLIAVPMKYLHVTYNLLVLSVHNYTSNSKHVPVCIHIVTLRTITETQRRYCLQLPFQDIGGFCATSNDPVCTEARLAAATSISQGRASQYHRNLGHPLPAVVHCGCTVYQLSLIN